MRVKWHVTKCLKYQFTISKYLKCPAGDLSVLVCMCHIKKPGFFFIVCDTKKPTLLLFLACKVREKSSARECKEHACKMQFAFFHEISLEKHILTQVTLCTMIN